MIVKLKPKSEFSRNVLTLLLGTVMAQAIPLAITPILTRLYSPEDFGVFALYLAITSITAVIATGRYEQAIMLPTKDSDAATITILAILLTLTASLFLFIIVLFFNTYISQLLERPEIAPLLYLVPISVVLTGIFQSLNYWNNRKKQYKRMAASRITQTSSMSALHILGGVKALGPVGLISGDIIGKLVGLLVLLNSTIKNDKKYFINSTRIKIMALAKRYKKFPTFDTGASLANIGSYQVQNILFPVFFGLVSAGHYFLILKVLQAPLSLVSGALTDVYKQKLTSKETTEKQLKVYYKKMFLFLFVIGIVPFALIGLYAKPIFGFAFGQEWESAGEYASILAPMFFIRFIASPLSYFLYLKEKQEINIIAHITLLVLSTASFYLGNSASEVVVLISISFSLVYIWYIYYSAKLSGFKL